MKIRRITATPINLPLEAPYIWAFGELPGFSVTIVEVEHLVEIGEIPPDQVHTPGVYVKRIFQGSGYEKRIEKRTVRKA